MSSKIKSIYVWGKFVRIFHWTLVLSVVANYFLLDDGKTVHQWIGYLAFSMVLARIVWGFIGTKYARFSDFFPTPKRVWLHVQQQARGDREAHIGHNPLGALMMLALLTCILSLGVTGWMQTLDPFWGDEWLQNLHRNIGNILIGMAVVQAVAAIVIGRLERTRLIKAMVTGVKDSW
jgi:cytochrome b